MIKDESFAISNNKTEMYSESGQPAKLAKTNSDDDYDEEDSKFDNKIASMPDEANVYDQQQEFSDEDRP